MNPNASAWQKLAAAARRWRDERETAAPYGFAVQVAARAMAAGPGPSVFERLSWRALGVALLLALVSLAANYSALVKSGTEDGGLFDETAVTAVFDVS